MAGHSGGRWVDTGGEMGDHQVGGHRRGDGGSSGGWTQEGRWGIIRWVDTGGEMGDHQVGGHRGGR